MPDIITDRFDAKSCGSCAFWEGERTICNCDVEYSELAVGKCSNPDSPVYGRSVKAVFYCFSKKDLGR